MGFIQTLSMLATDCTRVYAGHLVHGQGVCSRIAPGAMAILKNNPEVAEIVTR